MSKSSIIIIIVFSIVIVSLAVIGLLLLIPQSVPVSEKLNEYKGITKTEYTYEPTKNIQEEPEIQQYVITPENVTEGKAAKAYVPGKTNPFAAGESTTGGSGTGGNTTGGTTNSGEGGSQSGGNTNNPPPASVGDK